MKLGTLKKGLEVNKNITDKGGNFDYYIAKIGHLKKNIAIGKYDIFVEAPGQYRKVAEVEYDDEVTFTNSDTKESQWFEGLARTINDKYKDEEEDEGDEIIEEKKEEPKKLEDNSKVIEKKEKVEEKSYSLTEKKESSENKSKQQEVQQKKTEDFKYIEEDDFSKNNEDIIESISKNNAYNHGGKKEYYNGGNTDFKVASQEAENKNKVIDFELVKKYLKKGTKVGFPLSQKFLYSIGYVFYSDINFLQKIFLSILLLASSIFLFCTSLVFTPIYILEFISNKIFQAIKRKVASIKDTERNLKSILILIFIKIPILLFVAALYVPVALMIFILFLSLRTLSFSVVMAAVIISIASIFIFGYLFYQENAIYIFQEEFNLEKYRELKRQRKEEKKKNKKSFFSFFKKRSGETERKSDENMSLSTEEKRYFDVIDAFIKAENERGIKGKKSIINKVDRIISTDGSEGMITNDLLVDINRKLILRNREITNALELKEALSNAKVLKMLL
jgi:hypothetical protein